MNKIRRILLSVVIILAVVGTMVIGFGLLSMAEEKEMTEPVVIAAEDIGIKTNEYVKETEEEVEKEPETEDVTNEDKTLDANVQDDEYEEVTEAPEGKSEGYVASTYFEPNENDCDVAEVCYSCENDDHIFIHCVSYDEDNGYYIYEEWCEVCGHGSDKIISDEEFNALGVETDVEF